ncbi:MAG: hypothetical protein MI674_01840 [Cytophagales bacterium]|nr:hypothetical protein [Cytophagales bacterium]
MTNKLKSNLKQTLCGALVAVAMVASCGKKNEGDNVGPVLTIESNQKNIDLSSSTSANVPFSLRLGGVDSDKVESILFQYEISSNIQDRKLEKGTHFNLTTGGESKQELASPGRDILIKKTDLEVKSGEVVVPLVLTIIEDGKVSGKEEYNITITVVKIGEDKHSVSGSHLFNIQHSDLN